MAPSRTSRGGGGSALGPIMIALIASIPPMLLAIGVLVTSLRTNTKADVITTKTDAITTKADEIIEKADVIETKTDEIHDLANSNLTEVKEQLATANERIDELQKLLTKLVEDKSDEREREEKYRDEPESERGR